MDELVSLCELQTPLKDNVFPQTIDDYEILNVRFHTEYWVS
jgi:hypothetical protein